MASFLDPNYYKARDSASSGAELTDLNPEQRYDVDIRRLGESDRAIAGPADTRNERQQNRVEKFFRAAKSAGKFRTKAALDEPLIRGQPTQNSAYIDGTYTPSLGDRIGVAGGMQYASKPQPFSGKPYNYLDGFS